MAIGWNETVGVIPHIPPKPVKPALNGANPIARGLVFAVDYAFNISSGTGNHLDLTGNSIGAFVSTPGPTMGPFGQQCTFGNSTADSYTTNGPVNSLASGTVEFLAKPNVNDFGAFFNKGTNFFLNIGWVTGDLFVDVDFSTTNGEWQTTGGSFPFDQFCHVVVTYNGSSASNTPTVYINGIPKTLQLNTAPVGTRVADDTTLLVANYPGMDADMVPDIVYMRYWNRILSISEARSLFNDPWQVYVQAPPQTATNLPSSGTNVNLTAVVGTGAATAFTPTVQPTFSPATAVGTIGGVTPTDKQTLPAVAGAGAVAGFTPSISITLNPAVGTGVAAGLTPSSQPAVLAAAIGLGAVSGFTPNVLKTLAAATATGIAAGLTPQLLISLAPAVGLGQIGNFNLPVPLGQAIGLGAIGGFVPTILKTLAAATGTGVAAGFVPGVQPSLAAAIGLGIAAGFTPSGQGTLPPASGLGQVAGFVPSISIALLAAAGVGIARPFTANLSILLAPAVGIGTVASLTPTNTLASAIGIGVALSFLPALGIALVPVVGLGVAGNLRVNIFTPCTETIIGIIGNPQVAVIMEMDALPVAIQGQMLGALGVVCLINNPLVAAVAPINPPVVAIEGDLCSC